MWRGWLVACAVLLLLLCGSRSASADPLPKPTYYEVTGADADGIREAFERSNGARLPAGPFLIVTVPGSEWALFWLFVDGHPLMSGYVRMTAIRRFLGSAA